MSSLELRNIVKNYGAFEALKGVGCAVEPGEFVVLVGPSGCGKSTLLRCIAGLENISSGDIVIGGTDVVGREPSDRGVAMVFQNYALYPHMTVSQNMGFALKMAGRSADEIDRAVKRAAEILRIAPQLDRKPKELSGGQKQRVAIGRAITRSPEVFLFDEPLSNLDAALRSQMRIELGRLHDELRATIIYVTHDQTEAMTLADRIVVMNDGHFAQIGSPLELYNRPANLFVAGFLGSPRMNFFGATVVSADPANLTIRADGADDDLALPTAEAAPPEAGSRITIGIRPEAFVQAADDGLTFAGVARVVENLGRETLLYLDCPDLRTVDSESQEGYVAVQQSSQFAGRHGERFSFGVNADAIFVFDGEGNTVRFPSSSTSRQ